MKSVVIVFSIIIFSGFVNAQTTFQKVISSGGFERARSIEQTSDGGYIIAGNNIATSWSKAYLIKMNANGGVQWSRLYGAATGVDAYFHSVVPSSDGGYLAVGYSNGWGGGDDIYVVKTDSVGNLVWSNRYSGGGADVVYSVENTDDGGYILVGSNSSYGAGGNDLYMLKLDVAGTLLWKNLYGGTNEEVGYDVKQTSDLGFIAVGVTRSFGVGFQNVYLVKTNSLGDTLWTKVYGGTAMDHGYSVCQTSDGGYFITGNTNSFGPSEIYALKTDSFGMLMWSATYGGTLGWVNGEQTTDGGYVITGFRYLGYFGGIQDVDVMLIKTDALGDTLWTKSYGNNYIQEGYAVRQVNDGGYVIVGGRTAIATGGSDDIYVIKTDTSGNSGCEQTSLVTLISTPPTSFGSTNTIVTIPPSGFGSVPTVVYSGLGEQTLCYNTDFVWPGDTDNNTIVDNLDFLPIGIYYGQSGVSRDTINNVWQADSCSDWGVMQYNGYDLKHADCNGDGTIDANDTLAINLNFNLTHAFAPISNEARLSVPNIYVVTSSATYLPGASVTAEVWLGSALDMVDNLYGIAFDLNYDASLVQPASEVLTYPTSWLGTPGTNVIKIGKIDPIANIAYGAETRISHTNVDGYGKIAEFTFQTLGSIAVPTTMNFSISSIANDSAGAPLLFNPQPHSILINPLGTNIDDVLDENGINIFPNPYSESAQIFYSLTKKSSVTIEVYNGIGQKIGTLLNAEQPTGEYKYNFSASDYGYGAGVYFVKFIVDGKVTMKKLVEIK